MKKYRYINCINPELWINACHMKDKLKFSICSSKWSLKSHNRLLWLMFCCFSLWLSLFCKSAQNTSVFNVSCGIGIIREDNLELRDESLDINETKACNCHWHSFKENIQTDRRLLFTWEGRGFLWCCLTQSFEIRVLTEGQPLFSYNEQYATASFPLHCWPATQENHNHAFVTVHEGCKHKKYNGNKASQCRSNDVVI